MEIEIDLVAAFNGSIFYMLFLMTDSIGAASGV